MVSRIVSYAFEGTLAHAVDVQAQIGAGMPSFAIVGLADKAVAESRERIRSAFASLGLALPAKKITVNLAPADLPKEGSHFDLPIAMALLGAMGIIAQDALDDAAAIGELSLDGALNPTRGALPAAMSAHGDGLALYCPEHSGAEAAWSGGHVLACSGLLALIGHCTGSQVISPARPGPLRTGPSVADISQIRGQDSVKRALEIAAAGGHNILMTGPPGSGKSMLAQRLPGLLPPLDARELLEVSQIQSIAGLLADGALSRERPFRSPHHSASMAAMIGGGIRARPGEVSLAHHGILFLDELPEFPAQVIDSLRQPIESGEAIVARANRHVRYPARFQLVAAANPCKCGGGPLELASCRIRPRCMADYMKRLSGPFMDRIDLFVDALPVAASDLIATTRAQETSETVAARVAAARLIQADRYTDAAACGRRPLNADADVASMDGPCEPDAEGQALVVQAADRLSLSARGYHRVLKLARTIADLDRSEAVRRVHVAEALGYRHRRVGEDARNSVGSLDA